MAEALGGEVPRIFAEQLGDRPEHATLDEHAAVQVVGAMESGEPLDRQPKQDHTLFGHDHVPAVDATRWRDLARQASDFEGHPGEVIRPQVLEVLGGGRDSEIEQVRPGVQQGKLGARHGGA